MQPMNAPAQHPAAVRTTCPYCGVGCGVLAKPDGRGGAAIAGDPEHPSNFGRLCSKGSALGETLGLDTRLLHSRLRTPSSVAGHRRAFGADTVPGTYADLDEADLIVLTGSNAAWCHPVLYQRMLANKQA